MCTVPLPSGVNPIAVKYILSYHKDGDVPVNSMKIYKDHRGVSPLILNLDTRWEWSTSRSAHYMLGERTQTRIEYESGWA